nr:hypothetical protein Q903MT_gene1497 [Picea sitchensis]
MITLSSVVNTIANVHPRFIPAFSHYRPHTPSIRYCQHIKECRSNNALRERNGLDESQQHSHLGT